MNKKPYVGVTGFTKKQEVDYALNLIPLSSRCLFIVSESE